MAIIEIKMRRKMVITVRRTVTYAMLQLGRDLGWKGGGGKKGMKTIWSKPWFKNISPNRKDMRSVRKGTRAIDGAIARGAGRRYILAMGKTHAHWYLLSGHHAGLYTNDPASDRYTGFFNESYHSGRWIYGSLADPDARPAGLTAWEERHWQNELFLRTWSAGPPNAQAPFPTYNPLLLAGALYFKRKVCKGIILGGCNTLGYPDAVREWARAYPKSLIFGSGSKVGTSAWVTHALVSAKTTQKKAFWVNPASVLSDEDKVLAFFKEVARKWPAHAANENGLVMLYNGHVYLSYLDAASKLRVRHA